MIILHGTTALIVATFGLVFMSITIKWANRCDISYEVVNIDKWKEMNITNMSLKKKKAILEREIIKFILEEDEEENIIQINY